MGATWKLKGYLFGACSCDWGCPCSFNAPPTKGFCEGGYTWHVTEGSFDGVDLRGLTFGWYGHSPGPLHLGNVTGGFIYDGRATPTQREALLKLTSGAEGGPWQILAAVTATLLEPLYERYDITIDGLNSNARAGNLLTLRLAKIQNPVTGADEALRLLKPTGFTSKWADLGRSQSFQVNRPDITFDHSGQYAEFAEFDYVAG